MHYHDSLSDDQFPAHEQDAFSRIVIFTRRELSITGTRQQEQLFAPDAWTAIEYDAIEDAPAHYYDN